MQAKTQERANELMVSVEALKPLIEQHSDESERNCRLSSEVANGLRDAGLFRMLRPKVLGGLELDPVSFFRVVEEISTIESSVGWNVGLSNAPDPFGAWLSDEGAEEVFDSSDAVLCGAFFPPRRAIPVEGGFRISGKTGFNSNCHAATWVIANALIYDENGSDSEPRLNESGDPATLLFFFPAADGEIIENWDTLGMRGTGSHDLEIADLFVPETRTAFLAPLVKPATQFSGPLHRLSVWPSVGSISAVALGIAQASMNDFLTLGKKIPSYMLSALAERPLVQSQIGEAEARLRSARSLLHSTFDEIWERAINGEKMDMSSKARCQAAVTYAVIGSAEVIDLVHELAGTTAIRNEFRFQKHHRDIHVLTQHAFASRSRFQSVGQVMLGAEPEWPFFSL